MNAEELANFYAYVGALFLVLGFLFQLGSTIVAISFPIIDSILIAVIALLLPLAILYFLTGQTPGQTRWAKFKVVFGNIRRTFLSPIVSRLVGRWRIQCDECLKYIPLNEGQVWYVNHDNTKEYPYLHTPMFFHFGHASCLELIDRFSSILMPSDDIVSRISPFRVDKVTPADFMKHTYPELHKFMQDWKRNWESVHHDGSAKQGAYGEVEMDDLRKRLYHAWRRMENKQNHQR